MHEFFKVIGDETRLRCLAIIETYKNVCVCELVHALELPQSKISRHLSLMKLGRLVSQRRENQWVLYSISSDLSDFEQKLITTIVTKITQSGVFKKDKEHFLKMENRPQLSREMQV